MKFLITILFSLFLFCGSPSADKRGADGLPPVRPDGTEWTKDSLHEPLPEQKVYPDSEWKE